MRPSTKYVDTCKGGGVKFLSSLSMVDSKTLQKGREGVLKNLKIIADIFIDCPYVCCTEVAVKITFTVPRNHD